MKYQLTSIFNLIKLLAFLQTTLSPYTIQAQTIDVNFSNRVNGEIKAIAVDEENSVIYLGGEFSRAGKLARYGALLDEEALVPESANFPNGTVLTSVSDGKGGYYIGGEFSMVGGKYRHGLAHINSEGSVSDFASGLNLNDKVQSLALDEDNLYFGGSFTTSNAFNSYGGALNKSDASINMNFPIIDGQVYTSVSDGNGGLFIGGLFSFVGGVKRKNLAHINDDGEVTDWNPEANERVYALALNEDILYVGGNFQHVGGKDKQFIAAVEVSSGIVTEWNPSANSSIRSIIVDDENGIVYLGGFFVSVGGQARNRIAAIDADTGLATAWNPGADKEVLTLTKNGNSIYAGGAFENIGGKSRSHIAEIDIITATATDWSPNANRDVRKIIINGDDVFVGGDFRTIGGFTREGVASVDIDTGLANSWNANLIYDVYDLLIDGTSLYVGGNFNTINGETRQKIAKLDLSDASLLPLSLTTNGTVYTISNLNSSTIFIGGFFSSLGGDSLDHLGAIDTNSGELTNWQPNVSGTISSIVLGDDVIYIGGNFSEVEGLERNNIAAIDPSTSLPLTWNPNTNSTVNTMVYANDILYIGGSFTTVGGLSRRRAAAINPSTGIIMSWNPGYNSTIYAMIHEPIRNVIYVGGTFGSNGIEAVDAETGITTAWNPAGAYRADVRSISFRDGYVYAGGSYTASSSTRGDSYASLLVYDDFTGSQLFSFNPSPFTKKYYGKVYSTSLDDNSLFVGGSFLTIGGSNRSNLASFDSFTGELKSWDPSPNKEVTSILLDGNELIYAGGRFSSIGGVLRNRIAALDIETGIPNEWNPDIEGVNNGAGNTGVVYDMFLSGNNLYLGGNFIAVGGDSRRSIAAIDITTGLATNWNPNPTSSNSTIYSLAFKSDTVFVGGSFTNIGGQNRNNIASLFITDGSATTWNPNATGLGVKKLLINESLVYAAGNFASIGGKFRNNIAALSLKTGLATDWNPNMDNQVFDLVLDGSEIIIAGGLFNQIGTNRVSKIAAIDLVDASVKDWSPDIDGLYVNKIKIFNRSVLIGGNFEGLEESYSEGFLAVNSTSAKLPQNIQFDAILNKTYGDPIFSLGAISDSENEIFFTSSDSDVIEVLGSMGKIINAGIVTLTAYQNEDDDYLAASASQEVTVKALSVVVTIDPKSKIYGEPDPILTYQVTSGTLIGDDMFSGAIDRDGGEDVGAYLINQNTLSAGANYDLSLQSNTLTINKKDLVVSVDDQERKYGDINPEFTYSYEGFAFDDDELVLEELPVTSSQANEESEVGTYPIIATGGVSANYTVNHENGNLTIVKADQTIKFDPLPTGLNVSSNDFTLNANATSGLEITFNAHDESIISISGSTVTILANGQVEITALQGGNGNYNKATPISQTLSIETILSLITIANNEVDIYPNPSDNYFHLNSHSITEYSKIKLFDVQSIEVASYPYKRDGYYRVGYLNDGIYLIILEKNNQYFVAGKILVNHK